MIFGVSPTKDAVVIAQTTVALLGSSSGRFKSSIEAIKAEAITELKNWSQGAAGAAAAALKVAGGTT